MMTPHAYPPRRPAHLINGFTLIEAIVTIAILGILGAIVAVFIGKPIQGYFDSARTCYNFEISKLSPKFLNDLYSSQNGTDPLIQPSSSWAGRPKKPSTP